MFTVDRNRCEGCGVCVQRCPVGAISLVGGKAAIDGDKCIGCGTCAQVCPRGAISEVGVPERAQPGKVSRLAPVVGSAMALLGRLAVPYLMDVLRGHRGGPTGGRGRGFRRRGRRW